MRIENPKYTADDRIDCDIDHPVYGWIPFTADPEDHLGEAVYNQVLESGIYIAPYEPEPEPTAEELLDRERASMRCSPAQMRVALHRMGLLAQVQDIADGDAEASIVWEYATVIVRNSPFIDALSVGNFTPEEIDNIFNEAMAVVI